MHTSVLGCFILISSETAAEEHETGPGGGERQKAMALPMSFMMPATTGQGHTGGAGLAGAEEGGIDPDP
jgi:hypothetical protein